MNRLAPAIPTPRELITEMRCAACMAKVNVSDSHPDVVRLTNEIDTDEFDAFPLCDDCAAVLRRWLNPQVGVEPDVILQAKPTTEPQPTRTNPIPNGMAMRACH